MNISGKGKNKQKNFKIQKGFLHWRNQKVTLYLDRDKVGELVRFFCRDGRKSSVQGLMNHEKGQLHGAWCDSGHVKGTWPVSRRK